MICLNQSQWMFRKATVTRRRRPVTFTEGEKVWARNYSHGQKWVPGIRLAKQCIKLKLSKEVLRRQLISYAQIKLSLMTKLLKTNPLNWRTVNMVQTNTHSKTGSPQRGLTLQLKSKEECRVRDYCNHVTFKASF